MPWRSYLLISLLLVGCALTQAHTEKTRRQHWGTTWTNFSQALRWQRAREVTPLVAKETQARFATVFVEQGANLRIWNSEIMALQWDPDSTVVIANVQMSFTALPSLSQQQVVVKQRWEERGHGWRLVSQRQHPDGGPLDLL